MTTKPKPAVYLPDTSQITSGWVKGVAMPASLAKDKPTR